MNISTVRSVPALHHLRMSMLPVGAGGTRWQGLSVSKSQARALPHLVGANQCTRISDEIIDRFAQCALQFCARCCSPSRPLALPSPTQSSPHRRAGEEIATESTPHTAGHQVAHLPTLRATASDKRCTRSSARGAQSTSSWEAGTLIFSLHIGLIGPNLISVHRCG